VDHLNANGCFWDTVNRVLAISQKKPIWITQSAWPVNGPTNVVALPSVENAQTYYWETLCQSFREMHTFMNFLQDFNITTSYGVLNPVWAPIYNTSCGTISGSTINSTTSASAATYNVVANDTFYIIAGKLGVTLEQLEGANPGIPPTALPVGQVLNIPTAASTNGTPITTSMSPVTTPPSSLPPQAMTPLPPSTGIGGI
jgi:glucan endo-1,3-beta-D-glucosidase